MRPNCPMRPIRRTRALIDLDALDHNLALLNARAAQLMPAVKANGYGHGAIAIAKGCERWGVAMLCVANLDEYIILRDHGITTPILILEELFADELEIAIREAATLTVASLEFARLVSASATRLQIKALIHINIDTGMGRMGLYTNDLPQTGHTLKQVLEISALPGLHIEGLYTHFPAAWDTSFFICANCHYGRACTKTALSRLFGSLPPHRKQRRTARISRKTRLLPVMEPIPARNRYVRALPKCLPKCRTQ